MGASPSRNSSIRSSATLNPNSSLDFRDADDRDPDGLMDVRDHDHPGRDRDPNRLFEPLVVYSDDDSDHGRGSLRHRSHKSNRNPKRKRNRTRNPERRSVVRIREPGTGSGSQPVFDGSRTRIYDGRNPNRNGNRNGNRNRNRNPSGNGNGNGNGNSSGPRRAQTRTRTRTPTRTRRIRSHSQSTSSSSCAYGDDDTVNVDSCSFSHCSSSSVPSDPAETFFSYRFYRYCDGEEEEILEESVSGSGSGSRDEAEAEEGFEEAIEGEKSVGLCESEIRQIRETGRGTGTGRNERKNAVGNGQGERDDLGLFGDELETDDVNGEEEGEGEGECSLLGSRSGVGVGVGVEMEIESEVVGLVPEEIRDAVMKGRHTSVLYRTRRRHAKKEHHKEEEEEEEGEFSAEETRMEIASESESESESDIESDRQMLQFFARPPQITCQVQAVFGISTERIRNSARYVWESVVLWTVGNLVVLFDMRKNSYRVLQGHTNDVVAVAGLEKRGLVATSSEGIQTEPKVYVWDVKSCRAVAVIRTMQMAKELLLGLRDLRRRDPGNGGNGGTVGGMEDGELEMEDYEDADRDPEVCQKKSDGNWTITNLAFAPDGIRLACVLMGGTDVRTTHVCLIDWRLGHVDAMMIARDVSASFSPLPQIHQVKYNPYCPSDRFVTVGKKHVGFWRVRFDASETPFVSLQNGYFKRSVGLKRTMISISFTRRHTITGSISGEIYIWNNTVLAHVLEAHHGPVMTLVSPHTNGFVSGSKDGYIHVYSARRGCFRRKAVIDLNFLHPNVPRNSIKSLHVLHSKCLVGTIANDVVEVGLKSKRVIRELADNHFNDIRSLHCTRSGQCDLVTHPTRRLFATVAGDRVLRLWSIDDQLVLAKCEIDDAPSAVAFSASGHLIAVGNQHGCLSFYGLDEHHDRNEGSLHTEKNSLRPRIGASPGESPSRLVEIVKRKDRNGEIRVIQFSPDGQLVAIASGVLILFYDIQDSVSLVGLCGGQSRRAARARNDRQQTSTSTGLVSNIISMDWSTNSRFLRTTGLHPRMELRYFRVEQKGRRVKQVGEVERNIRWATDTCPLAFGCQGAFMTFETLDPS